jgi:hypothetical protein
MNWKIIKRKYWERRHKNLLGCSYGGASGWGV